MNIGKYLSFGFGVFLGLSSALAQDPIQNHYVIKIPHQASLQIPVAKKNDSFNIQVKLQYDATLIKCWKNTDLTSQSQYEFQLEQQNESVLCEAIKPSTTYQSSPVNVSLSVAFDPISAKEFIDLSKVAPIEKALNTFNQGEIDSEVLAVIKNIFKKTLKTFYINHEGKTLGVHNKDELTWFYISSVVFGNYNNAYKLGLNVSDRIKNKNSIYPQLPYYAVICKNGEDVFQPVPNSLLKLKGEIKCFVNAKKHSRKVHKANALSYDTVSEIIGQILPESEVKKELKSNIEMLKGNANAVAESTAREKERHRTQLTLFTLDKTAKELAKNSTQADEAFRKSAILDFFSNIKKQYFELLEKLGFPENIQAQPVFKKYSLDQYVAEVESSSGVKRYYDLKLSEVHTQYHVTFDTNVSVSQNSQGFIVPTKQQAPKPPRVKNEEGKLVDGPYPILPTKTVYVCYKDVHKFEEWIQNTVDKIPPFPTVDSFLNELRAFTASSPQLCKPVTESKDEIKLVRNSPKAWMVASSYQGIDGRETVTKVQYQQKGLSVRYFGNTIGEAYVTKSTQGKTLPEYLSVETEQTDMFFRELSKEDRYKTTEVPGIALKINEAHKKLSTEEQKLIEQEQWFQDLTTQNKWRCQVGDYKCRSGRYTVDLQGYYYTFDEAAKACKKFAAKEERKACAVIEQGKGKTPFYID